MEWQGFTVKSAEKIILWLFPVRLVFSVLKKGKEAIGREANSKVLNREARRQ